MYNSDHVGSLIHITIFSFFIINNLTGSLPLRFSDSHRLVVANTPFYRYEWNFSFLLLYFIIFLNSSQDHSCGIHFCNLLFMRPCLTESHDRLAVFSYYLLVVELYILVDLPSVVSLSFLSLFLSKSRIPIACSYCTPCIPFLNILLCIFVSRMLCFA
jgi:hypothetical protein